MKKLNLLIILNFLVLKFMFSQGGWTPSAIQTTTNLNVGLGTLVPTEKLHVNGNIQLDDVMTNGSGGNIGNLLFGSGKTWNGANGMRLSYTNSGSFFGGFFDVKTDAPNKGLVFRVDNINGGTNRMAILANGNVGIGTTAPTSRLSVVSSNMNDGIYLNAPGNGGEISSQDNAHFTVSNGRMRNNASISMPQYGIAFPLSIGSAETWISGYDGVSFFTNSSEKLRITSLGNIGIGTVNPTEKLQLGIIGDNNSSKLSIPGVYNFEQLKLGQYGNGASAIEMINHIDLTNSYGVKIISNSDEFYGLQIKMANSVSNYNSLSYSTKFKIGLDGKITIGNVTTPGEYLLYVEKGILTEKIRVALKSTTQWADFVFDKDYTLKSLSEVEEFIKENKHLPDVPSAKQIVEEGGVDVSVLMSKQMQKIEELTLYIIDQNKKIEKLEEKLSNLKK